MKKEGGSQSNILETGQEITPKIRDIPDLIFRLYTKSRLI
jgi:hypothetical protein